MGFECENTKKKISAAPDLSQTAVRKARRFSGIARIAPGLVGEGAPAAAPHPRNQTRERSEQNPRIAAPSAQRLP